MTKIKIFLIEDNRLLREGTTTLLNEQTDIVAVSSAGNKIAYAKAKKLKPDIVLLDIGLKAQNSLTIVGSIKKQFPKAHIIVLDLIPTRADVMEFVKAGVAGFLLKDSTFPDFLHTIRSVANGVKILPKTIVDSVFSQIIDRAIKGGKMAQVVEAVKLNKQEIDVIGLMAKGNSVSEISIKLKTSVIIIKSMIRNIVDKLSLQMRLELAASSNAGTLPRNAAAKP
jgi:DNA-binding NarL/FixJ family response regulator